MIDQWKAPREAEDVLDPNYTPDQVITNRTLTKADASRLAVVFPIWHGGGRFHQALLDRLDRQGVGVLDYKFHDQIIEPNIERVLGSYAHLQATMAEDLHQLRDEFKYQKIHFTGLSLGNVAMSLVAKDFPDFTSATFVAAGSNLGRALWEGIRTQSIKRGLAEQGCTVDELDEAWRILAPMNYARQFKDKTVNAVISTRDRIIPTAYQKEMLAALENAGTKVSKRKTTKGHYYTVGTYYRFRGKI